MNISGYPAAVTSIPSNQDEGGPRISLMDLELRRWYHCTATQRAAATKAQFWSKPIVGKKGAKNSQEGRTGGG